MSFLCCPRCKDYVDIERWNTVCICHRCGRQWDVPEEKIIIERDALRRLPLPRDLWLAVR